MIQQRLQISRLQIRREASRYLTGYDEKQVFGNEQVNAVFPTTTRLLLGAEVKQLRKYLAELTELKAQAERVRIQAQASFGLLDGLPPPEYGQECGDIASS